MPVGQPLELTPIDPLKAPFFLHRRELGIINVGGKGTVQAGDNTFELDYKGGSLPRQRRPDGNVSFCGRFRTGPVLHQFRTGPPGTIPIGK